MDFQHPHYSGHSSSISSSSLPLPSMYGVRASGAVLSRWWISAHKYTSTFTLAFVLFAIFAPIASSDEPRVGHQASKQNTNSERPVYYNAEINVTYTDRKNNKVWFAFTGKFGTKSKLHDVSGLLIHTLSRGTRGTSSAKPDHYGCSEYVNKKPFPDDENWIAFVERGECNFTKKIQIATHNHNAAAVVIYNNGSNSNRGTIMDHHKIDSIAVFIERSEGRKIVDLLESGYRVYMKITVGEKGQQQGHHNGISKTSVLFVSISFIVLMIISLAWLLFYYIQRFRYSHAKERLARRLACAAKKAIAKTPHKTIKSGDKVNHFSFYVRVHCC